jgi:phage baseplate assembly protein W
MRDIQFISMVDKLAVSSIEEMEGASPRTLRVYGEGLRSAQRVEINDYGVDSFTVASDRQLLVIPGDIFADVEVSRMTALVHSSQLTNTRRVALVFGTTRNTRSIDGIQKLIQQILKVLLSKLGSNRFVPEEGGDLLNLVGEGLSPDGQSQVSAAVSQAISLTSRYILAQQAGTNIPASERLMTLKLNGVVFDTALGEVSAQVRLTTMTGKSVEIPLTL